MVLTSELSAFTSPWIKRYYLSFANYILLAKFGSSSDDLQQCSGSRDDYSTNTYSVQRSAAAVVLREAVLADQNLSISDLFLIWRENGEESADCWE